MAFEALETVELELTEPRFEFDTAVRLSEHRKALSAVDAFDPDTADFDGIAPEKEAPDRHVDEIFNQTRITVDEEETEAVSVSVTGLALKAVPERMTVDRPFLFAIRDRAIDAVLFLGRVVDADAAQ